MAAKLATVVKLSAGLWGLATLEIFGCTILVSIHHHLGASDDAIPVDVHHGAVGDVACSGDLAVVPYYSVPCGVKPLLVLSHEFPVPGGGLSGVA